MQRSQGDTTAKVEQSDTRRPEKEEKFINIMNIKHD